MSGKCLYFWSVLSGNGGGAVLRDVRTWIGLCRYEISYFDYLLLVCMCTMFMMFVYVHLGLVLFWVSPSLK